VSPAHIGPSLACASKRGELVLDCRDGAKKESRLAARIPPSRHHHCRALLVSNAPLAG
jgi:hypothetical protein